MRAWLSPRGALSQLATSVSHLSAALETLRGLRGTRHGETLAAAAAVGEGGATWDVQS